MDKIKEIINSYLNRENTDYALHINGLWGSGKTHFIQNQVKNCLLDEEWNFIYVSLNGVKNTEEIADAIFLQLIGGKSAKGVGAITSLAKSFKSFNVAGFGVETNIDNIVSKLTSFISEKKLDKVLLCFDDLERIDESISIKNLFGFINSSFIEHNQVKTLFISDESRFSEKHKKEFDEHKEKLIRRTIEYKSNKEEIIATLMENSDLKNLYEKNKRDIHSLFKPIEDLNLRTVNFIIEIVEEILKRNSLNFAIDSYEKFDFFNEAMDIFIFTFVIGLNYKESNVRSVGEARRESDFFLDSLVGKTKKDSPIRKTILNNVIIEKRFKFYDSIAELVLTGFFDEAKFENEIMEKYKEPDEKQIALNALDNYIKFEKEDLVQKVEVLLEAVKNGEYKAFNYPNIHQKIYYLQEKDYIDRKEDLFKWFESGLNIALERDMDIIHRNSDIHRSFQKPVYETEKKLNKIIEEAIENKKKEENEKKVESIIELLEQEKAEDLREVFSKFRLNGNLFQNLLEFDFLKRFTTLKNTSINSFSLLLRENYLNVVNAYEYHSHEAQYMKKFKEELQGQLKERDIDKLKYDLLISNIEVIDEVIKHVSKS